MKSDKFRESCKTKLTRVVGSQFAVHGSWVAVHLMSVLLVHQSEDEMVHTSYCCISIVATKISTGPGFINKMHFIEMMCSCSNPILKCNLDNSTNQDYTPFCELGAYPKSCRSFDNERIRELTNDLD